MAQSSAGLSLRTTQRAPRSCVACSSRKVRCDKSVPCSTCIRRGEAEACVREMVIVRGAVTMYRENPPLPSYEELTRENRRLRAEVADLEGRMAETAHESMPRSVGDDEEIARTLAAQVRSVDRDEEGLEAKLWTSVASVTASRKPAVSSWSDPIIPSRALNDHLVAYDRTWNYWVHYALEYPKFEDECDHFMETIEQDGSSITQEDPAWLAVYFSVLTAALLLMDDNEAKEILSPEGLPYDETVRNWYDAAIFCLNQADFMRIPSIRSVQTIAILGICFHNMGDPVLYQTIWNTAIHIGQTIGLDTPYSEHAAQCLSGEGQHRLWWTIVICDWLGFRNQPAGLDDIDFDVPLPSLHVTDPGQRGPHPVHYHIFMARTAAVVYRFHRAIRSGVKNVEQLVRIVRAADEELAEVIDTLPAHLQPENGDSEEIRRLEQDHPWVKWQRFDLTVVLLHIRVRINRALQKQWLLSPGTYDWARSVSVRSAMTVIWINHNWDQPATMRKQWALSYHIFISSILLLRESQNASEEEASEYEKALSMALDLLKKVGPLNAVSHKAALVLKQEIDARDRKSKV